MARRYRSHDVRGRFGRRLIGALFAAAAILSGSAGPDAVAGGARSDLAPPAPVGLSGRADTDVAPDGAAAERPSRRRQARIFQIFALDGSPVNIVGFDPGAGDQIDLGAFLDGFGPRSRERDFIQMRVAQRGTMVAVDPSGSGQAFIDAALVVGVDLTGRRRATPDPLPELIRGRGLAVELLDVARVPGNDLTSAFAPLQYLYHARDGSDRLFVCDLRGQIWVIEDGALLPEPFLDVAAVLDEALTADQNSGGLRSFAFHPDFATEGAPGVGKLLEPVAQSPAQVALTAR